MNKTKYKRVIGALLALSTVSFGAQAAEWNTCSTNGKALTWPIHQTADMYISTKSIPERSVWDIHTLKMMGQWMTVGGSNFKFGMVRDRDGTTHTHNGINEIDFKDLPFESSIARTYMRFDCYWERDAPETGLVEADISLNKRYSWTVADFKGADTATGAADSPFNFEIVMLHELGHALGLAHSDSHLATMSGYYPYGGPNGHKNEVEPHADDRYGLRILYPGGSTERDLSVSRFHDTVYAAKLNFVSTTHTDGLVITRLNKGGQYDIQYTVENLGTRTEIANILFYISTTPYISIEDAFIGSAALSMPAGTVWSAEKRITIPTSLASGTYYIGYLVDPTLYIPESNEGNNSVSLLHPVTIH